MAANKDTYQPKAVKTSVINTAYKYVLHSVENTPMNSHNNAKLTVKQIMYGFNYYHNDSPQPPSLVEVSEYEGQTDISLSCTQLEYEKYPTNKARKQVWIHWCNFLRENPHQLTSLTFHTRINQELFDAACEQKNLKSLIIKWGVYPDLSKLENLKKLELLSLGSGASTQSIEPITTLNHLVALSIENFQKIKDYSLLTKLKKLESLTLLGDIFAPKNINIDSIKFLEDMTQLRFLMLYAFRLQNKDFSPLLALKNLEHLSLSGKKELKNYILNC